MKARTVDTGTPRPLVIYVTVSGVLGGVDTYITGNAAMLRGLCDVWVVAGYRDAVAYYEAARVERTLYFPMSRMAAFAFLPSVLRAVPRRRTVIIHSNDLVSCLWGKLLSFRAGKACRHFTTIHSVLTEHHGFSPWKAWLVFGANRALRRVGQNGFICVSERALDSLGQVGITTGNAWVLRHAVELPGRSAREEGMTRVGFVGRLSPEKGPDLFLECVLPLPERFSLHVFGEGQMRPAIERNPRVVLHGFVSEKNAIYSSIDIVCMTSKTEACPFVLIEALAAGCVPLVLDIPAFRELLGGTAFERQVVCVGVEDMRERIIAFSERRMRLDEADVGRFLARFNQSEYRERLLRVYGLGGT